MLAHRSTAVEDQRPSEHVLRRSLPIPVVQAARHSGTVNAPGDQDHCHPAERFEQVLALQEEMKAAGAWLFGGRLTDADLATVVRATDGEVLTTDGPFVESKEHLGGFYIVEADDLDAALGWAAKTSQIIGAPIEVRPFWDDRQA
jgi:hypothetical protein